MTTAVIEAILSRRSVRWGFADRPIPCDQLELIAECGLAAPSSKNARPWRLHVIQDRSTLDAIALAAESVEGLEAWVPNDPVTGRPHTHWKSTVLDSAAVLKDAPCGILIENRGVFTGGRRGFFAATPEAISASLLGYGFEWMGIGTALQNMWLAANSLGIAGAFLGDLAIVEADAQARFGFDGEMVGILALGYSDLVPSSRWPSPAETQTLSPVVWHLGEAGETP